MSSVIRSLLTSTVLSASLLISACDTGTQPDRFDELAKQGAYSLCINQTANAAFIGSIHHGGSFWRINPLDRMYNWNHKSDEFSNIISCSFSPEGNFAATTDNRTIALWNNKTGENLGLWNAPGDIKDINLSPNGQFALLAMTDYTATYFNIKQGGVQRTLRHDGVVYDASLNHQGTLAATASDDLTARIWDLRTGKEIQQLTHNNQVRRAQISANGRFVFTSALSEPGRLWNTQSGQMMQEFAINSGFFNAVRFNTDNTQLLTGTSAGKIQLWNLKDGVVIKSWQAIPKNTWVSNNVMIEDVAFTQNGYLAGASNGRLFHLN